MQEVLEAIKDSGGVKWTIARKLGVTRMTLDSYIRKWATVANAIEDASNDFVDMSVSLIYRNVQLAHMQQSETKEPIDTKDAKWVAARKRPEEWGDATKITGADGEGPVKMRITIVKDND